MRGGKSFFIYFCLCENILLNINLITCVAKLCWGWVTYVENKNRLILIVLRFFCQIHGVVFYQPMNRSFLDVLQVDVELFGNLA